MSQIKVFLNFNLHVVSESIPHSLLSLMVLVHQCSGIFWVDFPSNTLESRVAPVEQETQTEDAGALVEPEVLDEQRRQICQRFSNTNSCGSLNRMAGIEDDSYV